MPAPVPAAPAGVNPLKLLKEYHDFINTRFPAQLARKLASQAADLLVVEGEYAPLKTLSIDEIKTTEWPPPVWAIPDFLPVGLTFLAGKPKLGKSWLLLQVARAVSSSGMLFDKKVDEPGRVLYLALEDNARRLQDRIKKQGWDWRGLPIDFVTMAEFKNRMGSFLEGGAEALAKQIEESRYNLVIVDTLSRACFNDPNKNELMAATLAPVQELAMMANTALLFVDHHNKSAGALMDAIGDILGGTSKGATLDTAWGLYRDRGKQEANLAITGRDVEDLNLALEFDTKSGLWHYNGDYYALKITERRQEYLDLIADLDGSVQVKEVAQNLGVSSSAARQQLSELVNAGHLRMSKKGRYVFYELI
jgi:DNA-binding transcriptional ArsR family regulator